jgi:sensor histidine kinase YesM
MVVTLLNAMTKETRNSILHVLGSLAFLSIPIIASPDFEYGMAKLVTIPPFQRDFLGYVLLLLFFYFNYYYLIPKFYFNQKKGLYAFILVVCFLLYLSIPNLFIPIDFEALARNPHFKGRRIPHRNHFEPFNFGETISYGFVLCLSFLAKLNQHIKEIKTDKLNAEVAYLKAQINPHFLFNTLNSLYALTITKSDEAPDAVLKLSGIMRYVVTESAQDFVPLEKEINYIKDYIDLQKLRMSEDMLFEFSIEGNPIGKSIAPLVLIPFIENAFKYGINPEEESEISIAIEIHDSQLQIDVKNKMVVEYIPEEFKSEKGIEITSKRLDFIYPNKHHLEISEDANTYHVHLKLDLL